MRYLSILFGGDFAPCGRFEHLALEKGIEVFGNLQADISDVDISFLNLETPLCNPCEQISKSGPALRGDPECIRAVGEVGFNVAGLANNHIMDHGPKGLASTIEACEANKVLTVGAGPDLPHAQKPLIIQKNDFSVAIIAVAEHEFSIADEKSPGAAPLDVIENVRQIEEAKNLAEIVILTIHGGNEYFRYPRPRLRKICHFFVEQGADAIICHHPHVAGAYEIYNGRPIFYSLGNLLFDHLTPPGGWNDGYAVKLNFILSSRKIKEIDYEIIPYKQSFEDGGITKLAGLDRELYLKDIEKMKNLLEDEKFWISEWEYFCQTVKDATLIRQVLPFTFPGVVRLAKLVPFHYWLTPKKIAAARLNAIRCDSHRDVLIRVLEDR